jgi:hypothetical protein
MRWWPPLLHLALIAALLPLAWLRLEAALEEVRVAGGASAVKTEAGATETEPPETEAPADPGMLVTRPLFTAPFPESEEVAPPAAPTPERAAGLRMVGYLNDGNKPRAILTLDSTGTQATVREGDAFEGFRIGRISPDAVIVTDRGRETTVKMFAQ